MNPADYLQDVVFPRGTSLHYATLYLPPGARLGIMALFALQKELTGAILNCTDPGIARIKLQWWRDELTRLTTASSPQHPVSKGLHDFVMPTAAADMDTLRDLIDLTELDLTGKMPSDEASSRDHFSQRDGRFWALTGRLTGSPAKADEPTEILWVLGTLIGTAKAFQDFGTLSRSGIKPFSKAMVMELDHTDGTPKSTLAHCIDRLQIDIKDAIARVPAKNQMQLLHAIVYGRIMRQVLDEIRRDNYQVVNQRIDLTPLRKLWITWRSYRTART